ncbi:MAG: Pyruvate kinase, partial [Streblomastix strix]
MFGDIGPVSTERAQSQEASVFDLGYVRKKRLSKIFATIGQATQTAESIGAVIDAGADAIRLNFSHGSFEEKEKTFNLIRQESLKRKKEVGIMIDLQGPKFRCNDFEDGYINLNIGDEVKIVESSDLGKSGIITTKFGTMIKRGQIGQRILLDDGYIRLIIKDKQEQGLICNVEQGGQLKNKKGINLPETDLGELPSLTEKDIEDVKQSLSHFDVDFFALSFVRTGNDVESLRKLIVSIRNKKSEPKIYAKIEKPESITNLEQIISVSDGILFARGDLGVEIGVHYQCALQKQVINKCIQYGVPVCVCTQMLESVTTNLAPTRAEASDVGNAVFDGSDCVMLSGETASGIHPSHAVKVMVDILQETEKQIQITHSIPQRQFVISKPQNNKDYKSKDILLSDSLAICIAAQTLAEQTHAKCYCLVPMTLESGIGIHTILYAAYQLASCRSLIPIFIFTSSQSIQRALSTVRSVFTVTLSQPQ